MKRKKTMAKNNSVPVRIVGATEAKTYFGEMIKRAYEKDEDQIVERSGFPMAVIISVNDYIRLRPDRVKYLPQIQDRAERQQAWRALRKLMNEMQKGGEQFTEEEVEADVLRAVEEVRYGKKK
jgi:prevent-host-death family protein